MKILSYRQVIKVAWPILLANISIPLLGLIDTAILGHLDDAIYLGAVALGSQLVSAIFWSCGFLRMGTTGFTSRAMGANNQTEIQTRLQQACVFGALISALILVAQFWLLPMAMQIISDPDSEISALALEYTQIRIWSAPASLITYALVGWLLGLQKSKAAMWILVWINLLNILLDYILIVKMDLNSAGAAWASVAAEYAGLLIGLYFVCQSLKKYGGLKPSKNLVNLRSYSDMFISTRHLFIRTSCLLFTFLFFASQGARLGEHIIAANAILLNLLSLTAYTMDGFAFAAETLCGQAWGAKQRKRLIDACVKTTLLAAAVALTSSLILILGKPWILGLYTNLPDVIATASRYYLWLALLPIAAIWCYQLDGISIGMGQTKAMQNSMLAATVCVYLPAWWLTRHLDNTGLWISFWCFQITRSLFLALPIYRLLSTCTERRTG